MTQKSDDAIEFDFDSPLESVLGCLSSPLALGLFAFSTLIASSGKRVPAFPNFHFMPFAGCLFTLGLICWVLRRSLDVRYLIEAKTQQVLLVRKIFGYAARFHVADLADLSALAWGGRLLDAGKNNWEYALYLVSKKGRMIRVSSWVNSPHNPAAQEAAERMGLRVVSGEWNDRARTLKVDVQPDGVVLSYKNSVDYGWLMLLFLPVIYWLSVAMCHLFSY